MIDEHEPKPGGNSLKFFLANYFCAALSPYMPGQIMTATSLNMDRQA
jgi:hypothetical protein